MYIGSRRVALLQIHIRALCRFFGKSCGGIVRRVLRALSGTPSRRAAIGRHSRGYAETREDHRLEKNPTHHNPQYDKKVSHGFPRAFRTVGLSAASAALRAAPAEQYPHKCAPAAFWAVPGTTSSVLPQGESCPPPPPPRGRLALLDPGGESFHSTHRALRTPTRASRARIAEEVTTGGGGREPAGAGCPVGLRPVPGGRSTGRSRSRG